MTSPRARSRPAPLSTLTRLLVGAVALGAGFSAAAAPDYPRKAFEAEVAALRTELGRGAGAAEAVIARLRGIDDEERLDLALVALGRAFQQAQDPETAVAVVDRLLSTGSAADRVLAADVLLKAVDGLDIPTWGKKGMIEDFPEALCARAARLLDDPDPVVQGLAEWALSLRVKANDANVDSIGRAFAHGAHGDEAWYRAWQARDPRLALRDDYARQLAHLNRHRTVAGMAADTARVAARLEALLADGGTEAAPAPRAAWDEALAAARAAAAGTDLVRAHQAWVRLRKAARDVLAAGRPEWPAEGVTFFTNACIPGGVWNVNVPVTNRTNPPGGDIFLKHAADPAAAATPLLRDRLGAGSVRGLDLDWDGTRLLFSFWDQPLDAASPSGWDFDGNAHLFELDVATGAITPLTDQVGYNDIEPCFLPGGGYVFASDRASFGNQCAGPFLQNKRCTTLFRLLPGGTPVAISNNKDFDRHPHVLEDGTLVFLHWEYQERSLYNTHAAWRCRPDGAGMDAFYKQHIDIPMSVRDVRQAPGSPVCVATAQGHHDAHDGPIVLFDPSQGINNAEAMWLLTPGTSPVEGGLGPVAGRVVPEGGVENRGGMYINPFPLSARAFLCGHDLTAQEADFAVYYVDVWGHKELIHRDRDQSTFNPAPLRRRPRPPVVADTADPRATFATAFVENVYNDLPGVEPGTVRYLRLSQSLMLPAPVELYPDGGYTYNHLHYLPGDATAVHFGYWTWSPTRTIGIVEVAPDGSAFFRVPAGTPVYLHALDANFCEVRRMRTSFTLQRGEFRSCLGCHESRLEAAAYRDSSTRAALAAGAQTPVPPPWGDRVALDYRQHVQPVLDRHCVSCHGADDPDGGLDFTAREIGGFAQSFRTLFGLGPDDPTPIKEIDWHLELEPAARGAAFITGKDGGRLIQQMQASRYPGQLIAISDRTGAKAEITQPYQFGSNRSRFIRVLLDDPLHRDQVRAALPPEDWAVLVTWVDDNATYHGTLVDVRRYEKDKVLTRVPIHLPSPWVPADTHPSFLNLADSSRPVPAGVEAGAP